MDRKYLHLVVSLDHMYQLFFVVHMACILGVKINGNLVKTDRIMEVHSLNFTENLL
jgi:hypothetical protein